MYEIYEKYSIQISKCWMIKDQGPVDTNMANVDDAGNMMKLIAHIEIKDLQDLQNHRNVRLRGADVQFEAHACGCSTHIYHRTLLTCIASTY